MNTLENFGMDGNEAAQARQMEEMKRQALAKILDKEAFERLARVRIANPQIAAQVELYLLQLFQSGKLNERISDSKLREVLSVLSEKKEITIKRR